ncbi:MAG: TonB-dependent receptor [Muribaculaceae bacterium]|nr:TonB-dependent receptor [Muribaculaceae bacterium]
MAKRFFLIIAALMLAVCAHAQNVVASGTVIDPDGEPVIGASVVEAGTTNGTTTDFDGMFTLEVKKGASITISYIGCKPLTIVAAQNMDIKLESDSEVLQELVVTGYMTEKKSDLTGAVSVVSVGDLKKTGENNPVKAMQGRVPGMNISADGSPSGAASVRIRGIGTFNDNDPLYIIDGVPSKSGMHELNGNDIESIQVLKDAASASIYGSRAANGVIVITTKRGKTDKVKIDFDASVSASFYQSKTKVLNTKQYGQAMWQAYVNDGEDPNTNALGYRFDWGYQNGIPTLYGMTLGKYLDSAGTMAMSDTDWFHQITRTGLVHQYNLSLSRGGEHGSSYFSLGYYKNNGIIKMTDFQRVSARMNNDYKFLDGRITVGEHFTLNRTDEVAAPGGLLEDALDIPSAIPVYSVDGGWGGPVGAYPDRRNPMAILDYNKNNRYYYWRTFGDVYLNANLCKGLDLKTTFGIDYSNKKQNFYTLPYKEGMLTNNGKSALESKQEHWLRWMWNAVATYSNTFGKHDINAMVGTEFIRNSYEYFSGYKEGFAVLDKDYMHLDAGSGEAQSYGGGDRHSLVSFFGKANYVYDSRYYASVTLRHDGSSRFGRNNRFATFPAFSLGWRLSNEKFMESTKTWLSDLKIRGSWGQTGNQEISNTAIYTIYVPNYGTTDSFGGQSYGTAYDITGSNGGGTLPSGFKRNQLGNDDIKWETTTQTNIGIDFGLLGNSLYGSAEYYWKDTKDILILMPGVGVLGEGSGRWVNAGNMKNRGLEITLGYRGTAACGLSYNISGNIGNYRNEVTYLPETVAASGTLGGNGVKSVLGHPIYSQVGYIADGIFKSQDEVDNHATQEGAAVGRIRYRDINKDGKITEADQDWIYTPVPRFSYGLNVYLEYKNFDFTMFWQGVADVQVISDVKRKSDFWSISNVGFLNKGVRTLDAWSPANPDSNIPALTRSDTNKEERVSTYFMENGSFLKLRNIQLGYTLPENIAKKARMERLRFYISAQNCLTIKHPSFTGQDPENPNFGYPIPVNLTFGINVGF